MSAPPLLARRGAALRRHALTRGSVLGVGLLALGAAGLPAALAEEGSGPSAPDLSPAAPTPAVPTPTGPVLVETAQLSPGVSGPLAADFGVGKQFDLALAVDGAAPADLDLSGAQFAFTRQGAGTPAATCTTTATGTCTVAYGSAGFPGTTVHLTSGDYTITQLQGVDGLRPVAGVIGTIHMDAGAYGYSNNQLVPTSRPVEVTNVSEYSEHVTATVVDAGTGRPLAGAGYTLTAAAAPEVPTALAVEVDRGDPEAPTNPDVVVSDADGRVTFDRWFLPGDLELDPVGVPEGYVLGEGLTVTIPETPGFHPPATWALSAPLQLAAVPAPPVTPAPSPTGSPDPVPVPAPVPAPAPPVTLVPAGGPASTPATAGTATVPTTPVPSGPAAAPATPAGRAVAGDGGTGTTPAAPTNGSAPRATSSATAAPVAPAVSPQAAEPALETVSRSLPDMAVVGSGIAFLALVGTGLWFVLRRRARSAG